MPSQNNQNQATDIGGIGAAASTVLFGPLQATGAMYLYGLVTSTQTFELYVEISSDQATFTQAKKIVSAAGPDATYINAAELSQYAPSYFRVSAKNTSASSANFRADIRAFHIMGH